MKYRAFRIVAFTLTVACMVLIFCFSAQNSARSDSASSPIVKTVCKIVVSDIEKMPPEKQQSLIDDATFFVRKAAHFSIYFMLGVFTFCSTVTFTQLKLFLRSFIAFAVCVIYAVSDELHQYFVPGRSCELRDVCIDSSGALLAIVIAYLITAMKCRKAE